MNSNDLISYGRLSDCQDNLWPIQIVRNAWWCLLLITLSSKSFTHNFKCCIIGSLIARPHEKAPGLILAYLGWSIWDPAQCSLNLFFSSVVVSISHLAKLRRWVILEGRHVVLLYLWPWEVFATVCDVEVFESIVIKLGNTSQPLFILESMRWDSTCSSVLYCWILRLAPNEIFVWIVIIHFCISSLLDI